MNLPPALAPWSPYLQDVQIHVAPALGALAQRIATLIEAAALDEEHNDGEVDGYDGLARRGLPERMLLSDWLLAQEAPDEWSRRAAEGELSYLKLARRAPQKSKAVVAIFDAGPEVLGNPRLGQLAVLLVLERRAREMGAELWWGIAQKSTQQVWRQFSLSGVRALLEARGSSPIRAGNVQAWREALKECDERWLVGGKSIAALAQPGESVLQFEDPFEDAHALAVVARPHHGVAQSARLELPSDANCVRLLRQPLRTATPKRETEGLAKGQVRQIKAAMVPQSNLIWLKGNVLAARTKENAVMLQVPSSPHGGVPKAKHHNISAGAPIHMLCEYHGALLGARIIRDGIQVHVMSGHQTPSYAGFYRGQVDIPPSDDIYPLWNLETNEFRPFFRAGNSLYQLEPTAPGKVDGRGLVVCRIPEILTVSMFSYQLLAMAVTNNTSWIVPINVATPMPIKITEEENFCSPCTYELATENFLGYAHGFKRSNRGYDVFAHKPSSWFVEWSDEDETHYQPISVEDGATVFGVVGCHEQWSSPALVVRGANNEGLALIGPDWRHDLVLDEEIKHVTISTTTPYIAWSTSNEVVAYSLLLDQILARWQWGDRS